MSPGPAPNFVSLHILIDCYPKRTTPCSFDSWLILDSPYAAKDSKGSKNEEPERAPYRDRKAKEESCYGHGETDGNGESTDENHLVGGRPEGGEAEESQPPTEPLGTIGGNHVDASIPSTGDISSVGLPKRRARSQRVSGETPSTPTIKYRRTHGPTRAATGRRPWSISTSPTNSGSCRKPPMSSQNER